MKKVVAIMIAGAIGLTGLIATNFSDNSTAVLKVANWAEYIDGGDENSYLIKQFEEEYYQKTGKKIRVEYCVADDNEILYNMIKMGDHFDLICPSEYMLMKLISEGRVQKLPQSFYDTSNEENYYVNNVSPFILDTFTENKINGSAWKEYAAGYMWGTTGFVYNPETVEEEDVKTWSVFTNSKYKKKITAKNNIRDSYFTGLAMHYENDLRELKSQYQNGILSFSDYQHRLSEMMNDTTPTTMNAVKTRLMAMTDNLYGFETDEGKNEVISGKITVNYQWSGDAVYVMDVAEGNDEETEVENPIYLNYCIPETVSNLWFDGWTLTNDCKNVDAAVAFINFLSNPQVAMANMDYIGYTSCIAGDVINYVKGRYSIEGSNTSGVSYDLNYYFNPNYDKDNPDTIEEKYILSVRAEQLKRQLFAQYPDENTLSRCVAMRYFDADANTRANSMWSDVTFF